MADLFVAMLSNSTAHIYPTDIKVTELTKLAIEAAVTVSTNTDSFFDPRNNLDAKTRTQYKIARDLIGNNSKTRGGVTSNYTNKFLVNDTETIQELLVRNPNPLPWKFTDYVILSNGFCGSSCALVSQTLEELFNVTTVAVGGFYNTSLSFASFTGGQVSTLDQMLSDLNSSRINSTNNNLVPKKLPTNIVFTFPFKEAYSFKGTGEIVMEFEFRPAKHRIYYDSKSIRDPSNLWLQAVNFIQGN